MSKSSSSGGSGGGVGDGNGVVESEAPIVLTSVPATVVASSTTVYTKVADVHKVHCTCEIAIQGLH